MLLVTMATCTSGNSKKDKYVALSSSMTSHLYEMRTTSDQFRVHLCTDTFTMLELINITNGHWLTVSTH